MKSTTPSRSSASSIWRTGPRWRPASPRPTISPDPALVVAGSRLLGADADPPVRDHASLERLHRARVGELRPRARGNSAAGRTGDPSDDRRVARRSVGAEPGAARRDGRLVLPDALLPPPRVEGE